MEDVLVPIALFAMIAAIVIAPRYLKSQERQKMADTLRAAIERGQPLPPEVVDAMSKDVKTPPSPQRDLRTGIIWLGVAVGFAAMGVAIGFEEPDATMPMIGVACFPGFIGLAFIVMSLVAKDRR
ncbi:DUF6249 domain-containing protein [Phenylobacterium deserti]|uniref:DUF6249 domain-containing protein n=1 Tax=Phenylobacterium deserti TaxID=1914756 RepID=A0A328AC63_9CAUL|nr:DUF6249 domain-containing protein [Phenylobacterium deserti]RAK52251.1 hypothetical protein DJ018_13975 [Phenylobacterium deserti]